MSRIRSRFVISISLLAGLATLVACVINPATGRRELSLISEAQEQAIGRENDRAISAELGHSSITTTETCAKIVDRIAENPARYLEALLSGQ